MVAVVPQLEEDRVHEVPTAGLLPKLGRREDRHFHLLAADRIHLLADDLLELLGDSEPERQERVETRRGLPGDRRAQHQAVPRRLRLGGRLAQGAAEER